MKRHTPKKPALLVAIEIDGERAMFEFESVKERSEYQKVGFFLLHAVK